MGRKAALKRQRRAARAWPRADEPASEGILALRRELEGEGRAPLPTPPGTAKLSEVFTEFAAPAVDLLESDGPSVDVEAVESLLRMAQLVWNAFERGAEGERAVDELRASVRDDAGEGPEVEAALLEVIDLLVERRRTAFAHDHRFLADVRVTGKPGDAGGFTVAVAYTARDEGEGAE